MGGEQSTASLKGWMGMSTPTPMWGELWELQIERLPKKGDCGGEPQINGMEGMATCKAAEPLVLQQFCVP